MLGICLKAFSYTLGVIVRVIFLQFDTQDTMASTLSTLGFCPHLGHGRGDVLPQKHVCLHLGSHHVLHQGVLLIHQQLEEPLLVCGLLPLLGRHPLPPGVRSLGPHAHILHHMLHPSLWHLLVHRWGPKHPFHASIFWCPQINGSC